MSARSATANCCAGSATAEAALAALPDLAARGGGAYRVAAEARVVEEINAVSRAGARYLFHDLPDYPALLAES